MKTVTTPGPVETAYDAGEKDAYRSEAAQMIGSYEIVAGDQCGQKVPEERLRDMTVRIAADTITTLDRDENAVYAVTYELDTSRKPWRITMTATVTPDDSRGTRAEGLIECNGDTVRLIYALPGGAAPTDFKTGDDHHMFGMKRIDS